MAFNKANTEYVREVLGCRYMLDGRWCLEKVSCEWWLEIVVRQDDAATMRVLIHKLAEPHEEHDPPGVVLEDNATQEWITAVVVALTRRP